MTISGCLLVKNEAPLLAHCIESIAPFVEEIVVVDNGSSDQTRAVAKRYQAKVVSLPQANHDEGRNAYLQMATESWVFILDADERITSEGGRIIRQAIDGAAETISGFDLPRFEYIGDGQWTYIRLLRLFRNHPKIRYSRHNIHSTPVPDILTRGTVEQIYAPIHHIDILINGRTANKRKRNVRRLYDELVHDQNSPRLHYFLGLEYTAMGNFEEAEKEYKQAIALHAQGSPRTVLYLAHLYLLQNRLTEAKQLAQNIPEGVGVGEQSRVILAEIAYRLGDFNQALNICDGLLAHNPSLPHIHLNKAALLQEKYPAQAIPHLQQAIKLNPYLVKPIIYKPGEIPNIFQHQISFVSCVRSIYEHMIECLKQIGENSLEMQWKKAYHSLRQVKMDIDAPELYKSFEPPME